MAGGTPVYAGMGANNTYVKSMKATNNMVVSYSRNPKDFPLARYAKYQSVTKDQGYYLKITAENAARIVNSNLDAWVWPDGADRPRRNSNTEKFAFHDYRTERYDFDFTLGYKVAQQADWNIRETESAFHGQQAMTGRTIGVHNVLSNAGNWDAAHRSAVSAISGNQGSWEVSTTQRQDIKRSLNHARTTIHMATLGVVKKPDLQLVMNPYTAQKVGESQEVVDYIKGAPHAKEQIRGDGEWAEYGLPNDLYGFPIVIEDAVVTTSRREAATTTKSYVMADGLAYVLARPGALTSKAGTGPTFSTLTLFMLEELTVETKDDVDNRRTEGHVVDDYAPEMTSSISGFSFTGVTE